MKIITNVTDSMNQAVLPVACVRNVPIKVVYATSFKVELDRQMIYDERVNPLVSADRITRSHIMVEFKVWFRFLFFCCF